MPTFFNNCQDRRHAEWYGPGAFFDLHGDGVQADMATDLQPGDECVVATKARGSEDVEFAWFAFSHERDMPMHGEAAGTSARVLFGRKLRSERLPQAEASVTERYSVFFDVKRRFKRQTVPKRKLKAVR